MVDPLEELIKAVLESPKYQHITPGLVARIGSEELAKGRKLKDAVKATKNKLHQVGGAYFSAAPHYDLWLDELRSARQEQFALKVACRRIMRAHASTQERQPILEDFYLPIFAELPEIHSVLDVACGLNPLAIPWMKLAPDATFTACDIYQDMVDFLNQAIPLMGVSGGAEACDVIGEPPNQAVDLALVLKSIPCLEQVDKGAGERLLESIQAQYILVSFPAKSLGGREKGMRENYEERFNQLVAGKGWGTKRFTFQTELVFLVTK
jgi:16S rRNA (guanine(1405)-N(7))-methyltransferase